MLIKEVNFLWHLHQRLPGRQCSAWQADLISLLVFLAAIVLLFTGRYPHAIYDFVLGMKRWALRVAGYAGLMRNQYPPFRLDQGGQEPEAA